MRTLADEFSLKDSLRLVKYLREFNENLIQFNILNTISTLCGYPLRNSEIAKKFQWQLIREVWKTIQWDNNNIKNGLYPETVLKHKDPVSKFKGLTQILKDYPKVIKARKKNQTTLNGSPQYPKYYQRAFHFQTDGYLSDKSAHLYEQQVDILFTGLADIMRRCFVPFLARQLAQDAHLNILEMACGTGKGSELLREAFPNANYTLNDISPYYLEFAKEKLGDHFNYVQGPAENLSDLTDESFDVTFHIFLFHELPQKERRLVLKEQARLTKKGGFIIICDSLQIQDRPQWREILEDFPRRYHEPFYKNYINDDLEAVANDLDLEIAHKNQVLLTKCLILKK